MATASFPLSLHDGPLCWADNITGGFGTQSVKLNFSDARKRQTNRQKTNTKQKNVSK